MEVIGKEKEKVDHRGIVATYAQVSNWPQAFRAHSRTERTLAIFDEVHHAGGDNAWGKGLRDGFEAATRRLAMSGTPFRSDNERIPFVSYDDRGYSVPDYRYGYEDALRDGICRMVYFPSYEGEMQWFKHGEFHDASFADKLPERRDGNGCGRRF